MCWWAANALCREESSIVNGDKSRVRGQLMTRRFEMKNNVSIRAQTKGQKMCKKARIVCAVKVSWWAPKSRKKETLKVQRAVVCFAAVKTTKKKKTKRRSCNSSYEIQLLYESTCRCFYSNFYYVDLETKTKNIRWWWCGFSGLQGTRKKERGTALACRIALSFYVYLISCTICSLQLLLACAFRINSLFHSFISSRAQQKMFLCTQSSFILKLNFFHNWSFSFSLASAVFRQDFQLAELSRIFRLGLMSEKN